MTRFDFNDLLGGATLDASIDRSIATTTGIAGASSCTHCLPMTLAMNGDKPAPPLASDRPIFKPLPAVTQPAEVSFKIGAGELFVVGILIVGWLLLSDML